MLVMENSEEVLQILERYTKLKPKDIPKELEDYLCYVARSGDTVYRWSNVKYLFREKLVRAIKDFHDTTPSIEDLPQYPNVDPFNYESMKTSLLERLELFNSAPFTVQRLCELLTDPRKQYNRIDKYMRALEKNILVVSTIEPGRKQLESENGDSLDSVVNGDLSLDVNVEIDMENESIFNIGNSEACTTSTVIEANSKNSPSGDEKKDEMKLEEDNEESTASANEEEKLDAEKTADNAATEEEDTKSNIVVDEKPDDETVDVKKAEEVPAKIEDEPNATVEEEVESEKKSDKTDSLEVKQSVVAEEENSNETETQQNSPKSSDEDSSSTENVVSVEVEKECSESVVVPPKDSEEDTKLLGKSNDTKLPAEPALDASPPATENEANVDSTATLEPEPKAIVESETLPKSSDNTFTPAATVSKVPEQMSVEEVAGGFGDAPNASEHLEPETILPDQPMDENLEAAPAVLHAETAVNEVVMQSETEMATDPEAPSKPSDAGVMDIDDTSQEEAMDQ